MQKWHVWGDFVHTRPKRIGATRIVEGEDRTARGSAQAAGFDLTRRIGNGFESWAATYEVTGDGDVEFAFAQYPTVRGWRPA